jgi:hypothetical protein
MFSQMNKPTETYGLMAEFETPKGLLNALKKAKEVGYDILDAYTPYPIEEVCHIVANHKKSKVSMVVLIAGIIGGSFGFGLQCWVSMVAYPLNIGGRPYFSWPAFIPVTFELTILFAAFAAAFGMLALNRLPEPYHPVFNVEGFKRASQDRYFLVIEAEDPSFDRRRTRAFLEGLDPHEVHDVDW